MLFPDKAVLVRGNGFSLAASFPYRDFFSGTCFLQIESLSVSKLPPGTSIIATLTTPFVNTVAETVYGQFESVPTTLHQLHITTDAANIFFVALPTVRFRVTNLSPIFRIEIVTDALTPQEKEACELQVCGYFYKEL